ncbi:MAG TPA: alkaline phosphatase D family protein, partial [Vampirovibrionales bacterium]
MKNIFRILIVCIFQLCIAGNSSLAGSEAQIVSGPMLGYVEHREALIWLEVQNAKEVTIKYKAVDSPKQNNYLTKTVSLQKPQESSPLKIVLPFLEPNTEYEYQIFLDKQKHQTNYPDSIKTSFKTKIDCGLEFCLEDFSFLLGSCAFLRDERQLTGWDEGNNIGDQTIFSNMAKEDARFMLWLGDALYLRASDYSSESGIKQRYTFRRSEKHLQPFLASMSHYAIWDDHDYGPNNNNSSFTLRETSSQIFQDYWGNKSFGQNQGGIYSKFNYSDAEFFLLDNRFFRDDTELEASSVEDKSTLGKEQLQWLKNA